MNIFEHASLDLNQACYSDTYTKRYSEVEEKLTAIAKNMGEKQAILLSINSKIDAIPAAHSNVIRIPSLFLIKTEDIPAKFHLSGVDDPRLQSDEFLEEVVRWTRKFAGRRTHSTTNPSKNRLSFMEKQTIKTFLEYIRDPVLSEKAKEFVLSHEVAHIFHKHCHGSGNPIGLIFSSLISKRAFYFSIGLMAVTLAACLALPMPVSIIIGCAVAAYVSVIALDIFKKMHISHRLEKQADLTAAQASDTAKQGGVYLFDTFRRCQQEARRHSLLAWLAFSPSGNNRFLYLTHPRESQRVSYIKNQ